MKALIAGFNDQETAALEILVGMTSADARTVAMPRTATLTLPEQGAAGRGCDVCIVDLFGLGLRQHSDEHARRLTELLGGRPAVVVGRSSHAQWQHALEALGAPARWLSHPYTGSDMREALRTLVPRESLTAGAVRPAWFERTLPRAVPLAGAAAHAEPRPGPLPTAPRVRTASAPVPVVGRGADADATSDRDPRPAPPEAAELVPPGLPMGPAAARELVRLFPGLAAHPILRLATVASVGTEPRRIALGPSLSVMVDPAGGWIGDDALAVAARAWGLSAGASAGRLVGAGRRPADEMLWEMASSVLARLEPDLGEDLVFRLHEFPNLTSIPDLRPDHVQLSAICLRTRQSLHDLRRAFPRLPADGLHRFAATAVLAGLAAVYPAPAPGAAAAPRPPTIEMQQAAQAQEPRARARPTPERARGFLRALLARLF